MSGPGALGPAWQFAIAYGLDLLMGDPPGMPHPVRAIGRAAASLEAAARGLCGGGPALRVAGACVAAAVVAGAYGAAEAAIAAAAWVHPWAAAAASIWLLSTCFAVRGLREAATDVLVALRRGDLPLARARLAEIVGRDTEALPADEIARGAIETVAENASDAVVAPLLYAALGGAPLCLAYKAVNTLDSMFGHRDARYLHFGWAAARLDDLANLVPARLTALLLAAAAALSGHDWRAALRTAWRDAPKHPSPNAGWPEAAMAGALGVRLGGVNHYAGVPAPRAHLGEARRELAPDRVAAAIALMCGAAHLAAAAFALAAAAGLARWA